MGFCSGPTLQFGHTSSALWPRSTRLLLRIYRKILAGLWIMALPLLVGAVKVKTRVGVVVEARRRMEVVACGRRRHRSIEG